MAGALPRALRNQRQAHPGRGGQNAVANSPSLHRREPRRSAAAPRTSRLRRAPPARCAANPAALRTGPAPRIHRSAALPGNTIQLSPQAAEHCRPRNRRGRNSAQTDRRKGPRCRNPSPDGWREQRRFPEQSAPCKVRRRRQFRVFRLQPVAPSPFPPGFALEYRQSARRSTRGFRIVAAAEKAACARWAVCLTQSPRPGGFPRTGRSGSRIG